MDYMCFQIGSPSSLEGFIASIVAGKVKRWSTGRYDYHSDKKYVKGGAQLKGLSLQHIHRICGKENGFVQGHFRWNFRGYMVDRATRDYISDFWFNPDFKPKQPTNRIANVKGVTLFKYKEELCKYQLVVNTKWHRWTFTYDSFKLNGDERFTTNIGNGSVRLIEEQTLRRIFNGEKRAGRVRIKL
jgi:hypothetical protein